MKVCILTLGCKVNSCESGAIAKQFKNKGFEVAEKLCDADYYVINTCAVTKEAERKSRETITKCLKRNEKAKIFVLGCASENNETQFRQKHTNVVFVSGNGNKSSVLELIANEQKHPLPLVFEELGNGESARTRAFIKVQDGCNNFCSYCIIPYLRGRSRSRDINSVMEEINSLNNVKEIVLSGINLSDYKGGLITLAEEVDKAGIRFRFGSLEVNVITEDFVNRLKSLKHFCPHFHLSLQSGSNDVLKKMNRHYTAEKYIEACNLLKKSFQNGNITTDIIVGFPTETEADFNQSVELAKKAGFGFIHVFPYSKRDGTVASKMPDLDKKTKETRAKILMGVRDELKSQFIAQNLGSTLTVLTEDKEEDLRVGYTENYVKVYLEEDVPENTLVKVKLITPFKDGVKAIII